MHPLVCTLLLSICAAANGDERERPVVFVSIPPQAWIVEQLAGASVELHVLLPSASGHTNYSPAPSQIRALSRAQVYVRSGLPFENSIWERLREVNPRMVVVDPPGDFDGAEPNPHNHDHGHDHDNGYDPHFWLDPELMLEQAESVAAQLESVPASDSAAGMKRIRARLNEVDASVRSTVQASPQRSFWTFHGSWGHFAGHFGLEQHAIEFEGKEAGLKTMLAIIEELLASGARSIVVEPGLDRQRLAVLQNEAGLQFIELNPMRRDYDQNLLDIAAALTGTAP